MQSVHFYASSAFLIVLTLIALTTCEKTTTLSSVPPSAVTPMGNDSVPGNVVAPSEAPALNDEPKVQEQKVDPVNAPTPTRKSPADIPATPPSILHSVTTVNSNETTANDTSVTEKPNATKGSVAPKTEKKDKENGASRGGPEVLITSLIVLCIRAVYA